MAEALERRAVISGIGMSRVGRRLGMGELALTLDACTAAIEDAGLRPEDIDGLAARPAGWNEIPGFSGPRAPDVHDALRLRLDWISSGPSGNGQLQGVVEACTAVAMRLARHVLVYRCVTESSTRPVYYTSTEGAAGARVTDNLRWLVPFGSASGINWLAMFAQRHFHEFGTKREHLAAIALNARRNAARNPDAIYRAELTLDEYLGSRMISSPLCLFDCDVPVDGAVAFVVSHSDFAADSAGGSIHVDAVAGGLRGRPLWDQWHDMTTMAAHDAARALWSRTELTPDDVDVAELYDGTSIMTLMWLEALGFCKRGEAGEFVEGGARIALDGAVPLSTGGGQLSAGRLHAHGLLHEACVQLRHRAGPRQVPRDPEVALVSAGGGPSAGCMLLTRHR